MNTRDNPRVLNGNYIPVQHTVLLLFNPKLVLGFFFLLFVSEIQLKPGQPMPSPSELMGKILIKNKKGMIDKQAQTKKTTTAAVQQTATTAAPAQVTNSTSLDPANPASITQENQG